MLKRRVLIFARSFLAAYFADFKSDVVEPLFVTMTHEEKELLLRKGFKVYGCFEDEYEQLPCSSISPNYLKTSLSTDRFLIRFNYLKRLEILGKEISFWSRIYSEVKPDFLINETVAVEISEVMAIEAQKRDIPFYTHLLGFIPGTFYWKPDPFSGRLDDMSKVEPSDANIVAAEEYVNSVINKQTRPFYVSRTKRYDISIKTVLHSIFKYYIERHKQKKKEKTGFVYTDYSIFAKADIKRYWHCLYNNYDDESLLNNKSFIFYPLHVEPEAIINYFVDGNFSQPEIIENIVKSLKIGQYLVVKEHPQQQGVLLSPVYQQLKKKYGNIYYFPSYVLSFNLIKKCDAIVTLTSSVAWEGLMFEKPVFVFGKIFYDQCPGAIRIHDFSHLKTELHNNCYSVPQKEEVVYFAAKMISLYKSGCPTPLAADKNLKGYITEVEHLEIK